MSTNHLLNVGFYLYLQIAQTCPYKQKNYLAPVLACGMWVLSKQYCRKTFFDTPAWAAIDLTRVSLKGALGLPDTLILPFIGLS